jgi:GT2 family glycosyltransferase
MTGRKIKISIIIPTWNTAKITQKCIKTINKFLQGLDYEIIVVDNGSTDNTVSLLQKEKNVVLIKNHANLGFSKANNQAASIAKGTYLLFLNSDMELIDSSIKDMLGFIEKDDSIGAIGPQFLNPDFTPQASVFPPQTALNAFKEFFLNQKTYSKFLPSIQKTSKVWAVSGGALLIQAAFFRKLGGWNEKYFFYFEDLDLNREIHKFKKFVIYFPTCKLIHRHGASGVKLADANNQWRRLIPSSIKYHGFLNHYIINFIIWSGQKFQKLIFN